MDIKELFKTAKSDTSERFKQKLSSLVRNDYKYRNLSSENQEFLMNLIYKHIDNIRDGDGISAHLIQKETERIYSNRNKLGITLQDYEDIKQILNLFKK